MKGSFQERDSWFSKILKHYNVNPLLIWDSESAFTSSRHMFLHTLDPLVQFLPAVLPDPCSRMYRLFLFHSLQVLFWDLQGGCLRMYRLFLFNPLRVLWRACYPQLPPTGHRVHAASLLLHSRWLDLTMECANIWVVMLFVSKIPNVAIMNFFDDLANHNYHTQGIVFMRLPYFFTPADWTWRWNVQILCCFCPKYQMWRSWISLAILLSTITTHRASSSCGFSTYIHFLIGLDDGTWTNVSDYAGFVPIIN